MCFPIAARCAAGTISERGEFFGLPLFFPQKFLQHDDIVCVFIRMPPISVYSATIERFFSYLSSPLPTTMATAQKARGPPPTFQEVFFRSDVKKIWSVTELALSISFISSWRWHTCIFLGCDVTDATDNIFYIKRRKKEEKSVETGFFRPLFGCSKGVRNPFVKVWRWSDTSSGERWRQ